MTQADFSDINPRPIDRSTKPLVLRYAVMLCTRGGLGRFFLLGALVTSGFLQCRDSDSSGRDDAAIPARLPNTAQSLNIAPSDSAAIYLHSGRQLMKQQDHSAALEQLTHAVRLNPNSADAHNLLGLAYSFRLKPATAAEHFEKAIALDPDFSDYHMHLGFVYMQLTDYDGARKAYGRAIELGLHNPKPYFDLGTISEKENNLAAAQLYYEKAIGMLPEWATAYYRLGLVAEKMGDSERSTELYSTAVKYDPALTAAHYRLAQRYLELGRTSLAEIHLERFRDLKAAEQTP